MNTLLAYREKFLQNYSKIEEWKSIDRRIELERLKDDAIFLIFKKATYIKYDHMISCIKNLISQLDHNRKYSLFFPLHEYFKIGSENAIILECFDELSKLNICEVITSRDCYISYDLLIIDDAIYTGKHINNIMDYYLGPLDNAVIVTYAWNKLNPYPNVEYVTHCSPPTMFDVMASPYRDRLTDAQLLQFREKTEKLTATDVLDMPLIYFDHKVHDAFGMLTEDIFGKDCYPCRYPAEYVESIFDELNIT
tara:strand:+ start:353 stop:1105 length:753 start_codon:yes stop_codon:yes gene_type:complete